MENENIARANAIVVGGGLAGLTAAALLARGGCSVTLLEKSSHLGGLAVTRNRHGFLFNRGIHALYQTGPAEAVLRHLGVSYSGKPSNRTRYEAQYEGSFHQLPFGPEVLRTTSLLDAEGRAELARILMDLRQDDPMQWQGVSVQSWLDRVTKQLVVRRFFEAGIRLATYTHAPELLDAGWALHLLGSMPAALHLDGGWQTLVDGLIEVGRAAGATLLTGARVVAVEPGEETHRVRLADGSSLQAGGVILATEAGVAAQLVASGEHKTLRNWAEQTIPLRAVCLDVALQRLPNPEHVAVLHLDRPYFYSVHSLAARLAPDGGALLHIIKYLRPDERGDAEADQRELEAWLDQLQPGWRAVVVAQQFLPHIQLSSDMLQARRDGRTGRPGPAVPDVRNLYVAGDWVGAVDQLANASLVSAQQATQMLLKC